MRRKNGDRVVGIYGRRVVYVEGGQRQAEVLRSEAAAKTYAGEVRERLKRQAETTIGEALDLYLADRRGEWVPGTERNRLECIGAFFGDLDAPLSGLTPEWCQSRYGMLQREPREKTGRPPAAATHRQWLRLSKIFMRFCLRTKLLTGDSPLKGMKGRGEVNTGKPQLRVEELRKLLAAAWRGVEAGDLAALIILTIFWCGASPSEVTRRQVRDLDDGARLLWIDDAEMQDGRLVRTKKLKTKNRRRKKVIPAYLRPALLRQAEGRGPGDPLFPLPGILRQDHWVRYRLDALCARAGVPRIPPYSLRGMAATLKAERGDSIEDIAAGLGNTPKIAARHYVARGAGDEAAQAGLAAAVADPQEEIARLRARLEELLMLPNRSPDAE